MGGGVCRECSNVFFFMLSHRFFLLLLFFLKQKTSRTGVCDVLYITRGGSGWGGRGEGGGGSYFVKGKEPEKDRVRLPLSVFSSLAPPGLSSCCHTVLLRPHGSTWFHMVPRVAASCRSGSLHVTNTVGLQLLPTASVL